MCNYTNADKMKKYFLYFRCDPDNGSDKCAKLFFIIIIIYIFFITLLHELPCIYIKANIYNNAMIGDLKTQDAI